MFEKRRLREALADEKARTTLLRQQLHDTEKERDSWKWAATRTISSHDDLLIKRTRERDTAVRLLRTTEDQFAAARRENAERARRQVAYSNQAVANLRRLARALRACARYRAELAEQQRTTAWLGEQLLNSTGFNGVEPQAKQVAP